MTNHTTDDGLREAVEVGSRWRRKPPGREVVEVRRVWMVDGELTVRAHPTHGGRPIVAPASYLRENYIEVVQR